MAQDASARAPESMLEYHYLKYLSSFRVNGEAFLMNFSSPCITMKWVKAELVCLV